MRKILLLVISVTLGITSSYAQSMDWLCHPGEYTQIEYVGDDLFKVRTPKGKWGLMHADGELRVPANYDSITPFVENRALLLDKAGKRLLGLLDQVGSIIRDFSNEEIYVSRYPNFKDGRLAFGLRNGLYGYMNDKGSTVIEPQFFLASPFQNGVAAVQYATDDGDYGLINKAGRSVIISNEHYPFISAPVDGKVLVIKGSRKGADQLVIMRVDGTDLKKEKVLEDGMNIWLSDDFSSVECQMGHTYNLDNQWRIVSSSHNAKLPVINDKQKRVITESSTTLSKVATERGMKITYLGNPIMDFAFPNVATYDKSYAVVRSKDGKVGVLKLNPKAAITIKSPETPVVFNHNELQDVIFDVELVDVDPAKIKWYRNDQGWLTHSTLEQVDGMWRLRMPYFKSANEFDKESSEIVDIAITYDGLDWLHQSVNVKSVHQQGFEVTLSGSDITNENGSTTLNLSVKASDANSNPKGVITINGGKSVHFDGSRKTIPLNVSVSEGGSRTFTYTVVISEDGCPQYETTVSKRVSNPQREKAPKPAKKKIIIK